MNKKLRGAIPTSTAKPAAEKASQQPFESVYCTKPTFKQTPHPFKKGIK